MKSAFLLLFVAFAMVQAQQFQDLFFVDDFTIETPIIITLIPGNPSFPIVDTAFTAGPNGNIIGGERDLQLTTLSGDSNLVLTSGVASGDFSCATPNEANGNSLIQWDGVDGSMNLVPNGLGGLDFTADNAFALRLFIESDLPTFIDVFVYSGSVGSQCTLRVNLPGGDTKDEYILDFTDFSGSCSFGNVGAVEIQVEMSDNIDVLLELISVYGPVPTTPSPTRSRTRTPTPTPSVTPPPSNTCVCRCPIFVCEVFRLDDGDYYFYNFEYNTFFGVNFYQYFTQVYTPIYYRDRKKIGRAHV